MFFFFSSRRRHTRFDCDWSSDVCSSDLHSRALAAALASGQVPPPVKVPVGFTTFPGEIWASPRSWVEAVYPGAYFNEVDRGGHFAAWEEPALFTSELRAAFKALRRSP